MCDQEFVTQRIDPRFPNTNQTKWQTSLRPDDKWSPLHELGQYPGGYIPRRCFRACYQNYCDFFKCERLLGPIDECKIFKRYYETICPNYWIEHWDDLREKKAFPGAI